MTKYKIIGNQLFKTYPQGLDQLGIISDLIIDNGRANIYYDLSFNPLLKRVFVTTADMNEIEVT